MVVRGGIDEVGRGCLIGPIIFCMVTNKGPEEETRRALKEFGVTDSKKIKSPGRMATLAKKIASITEVYFKLASPEIIDRYVNTNDYNQLTLELVVSLIRENSLVKQVRVDSLGNSPSYQKYLDRNCPGVIVTMSPKADLEDIYCGAASICAKHYRNTLLEDLNRTYAVGTGYPADPLLQKFIKEHFDEIKNKKFSFIRYSWKTIKDLL